MSRALTARVFSALRGRSDVPAQAPSQESALFPRLSATAATLKRLSRGAWEPANHPAQERIRLLEAKVEYLLDEIYRLKSVQRAMPDAAQVVVGLRDYQIDTFDYQWGGIVYHDEFLSNPAWRERAPLDIAERGGVTPEWFRGKKVLDCGCGPGRHAWALASLGAHVTAFDLADRALAAAREATASFPHVRIEKRSILEPLPYSRDFDMVWCYGVLHHTGDTLRGLQNIAQHVRPGGRIYLMLYAEPRRDNVFDYQYRHEVAALHEATRTLPFPEKAAVLEGIEGPKHTLAWFDAISSAINDLYTFEEIEGHLRSLAFEDVRRTMPQETMHNVAAVRSSG